MSSWVHPGSTTACCDLKQSITKLLCYFFTCNVSQKRQGNSRKLLSLYPVACGWTRAFQTGYTVRTYRLYGHLNCLVMPQNPYKTMTCTKLPQVFFVICDPTPCCECTCRCSDCVFGLTLCPSPTRLLTLFWSVEPCVEIIPGYCCH